LFAFPLALRTPSIGLAPNSPDIMAKTGKRRRRTPEELIADLQAQIQEIEKKKAERELKQSPAAKAAMKAVALIDKALEHAVEEEDRELQFALADARKPLKEHLEALGVELNKVKTPRGRRPKARSSE
jgi:hypothetical protein